MTSIFQNRVTSETPNAYVKYYANNCDAKTKALYLMGRIPFEFQKWAAEDAGWQEFIKKSGVNPNLSIMELSTIASRELVPRIVDDALIEKIAQDIIGQVRANPEITSVRIVYPFPFDETVTNNTFAPALAAGVTAALEAKLPAILEAAGIAKLGVIADLDSEKSSREEAILSIVYNRRAELEPKDGDDKVALYMQRLTRQAVFSGKVDKNAAYVIVDDFIVCQSTVVSLVSYLQSQGAVVSSVVTGFQLFKGVEVLQPQQETLALLNLAIHDKTHEVNAVGGEEVFKAELNAILNKAGLNVDFNDVTKTNLSNIELLFLAGYFSNDENPEHQKAFEKALAAVDSSVDEARGNSSHDIFDSPPGSLGGLEKIFEVTLDKRNLMGGVDSDRYQDLLKSGSIRDYNER